ncbi:hypothetical protein M422DRAFT_36771 [Sphaerobolus stellatus SS14]|uniref:Uncharacterized protein n=1 Tax=Sphaerobolus stellatus (strain SS14) TaxID=990650 RepID=A0A0C9UX85_SPHS4|nr:hypothetical protein M422DRAFT_36771 [Sphaerobolus stellatus SS14]
MSVQFDAPPKLSKSQKKKKSAQKKKQAKKNGKDGDEQDPVKLRERRRDEGEARILADFNDAAMSTREFQMLNIKGKLLAHPSNTFLDAFVSLRLSLPREVYINRIHHAQRLYKLGLNHLPLAPWGVAMGTSTFVPIKKLLSDADEDRPFSKFGKTGDEEEKPFRLEEPTSSGKGAYADVNSGAARVMVWYPVFALCYALGDKLSCIALRDTCVGLRQCYTMFRNDTTRLEQFVFNVKTPSVVKRLDWVARRLEIPPSPPPTPPPETPPQMAADPDVHTKGDSFLVRDPFRAPLVVKKRWSDYDDDDSSLGSPFVMPIPDLNDVPELELTRSTSPTPVEPSRPATILMCIPTLLECSALEKTVLPVPRITLLMPEEYPRAQRAQSLHPMKLQASVTKPFPITANRQSRGRQENWVREDVEKNLKARLTMSSAAKKKADAEAEMILYNRAKVYTGVNTGDTNYIGEPDILGENVGISVDDVREIVIGRFKESEKVKAYGRLVLTSSPDGWICKHLDEKEI